MPTTAGFSLILDQDFREAILHHIQIVAWENVPDQSADSDRKELIPGSIQGPLFLATFGGGSGIRTHDTHKA